MISEARFDSKVKIVFPSPLMMEEREPFTYKKGQIKLKVMIKFPASSFLNKIRPSSGPNSRKKMLNRKPSSIHINTVRRMTVRISCQSFDACASETTGNSISATEPVIAVGNKTNGRAITVSTPKMLKEVFELNPYKRSLFGMYIFSILCRKFTISLEADRGMAKAKILPEILRKCVGMAKSKSPNSIKKEKRTDLISPMTTPVAERERLGITPLADAAEHNKNTLPPRRACSMSCDRAGERAFFLP